MDNSIIDLQSIFNIKIIGTACFILAVLHTFLAKPISELRHKFANNSATHNFLHFLGEIEVVFGFWAFIFLFICSIIINIASAVHYLDNIQFTEPAFVFCIICLASTKPILDTAKQAIAKIAALTSKILHINHKISEFFFILTLGPILGSFITEPAAMTVSALLIKDYLLPVNISNKFRYAVIGLLFVNVSIGGVLTNYAAPPVLMVAKKFGWNNSFMFFNFGWRALLAIFISTLATTLIFKKSIILKKQTENISKSPVWLILVHLFFMILIVSYHSHIAFFLALFLLFLGWYDVTKQYQTPLQLRESLLVGFFLAGLVTLGNMQAWWIEQAITALNSHALFFGAAALTSITDNAALTYLGSLVPSLSASAKYMLVAGSVVGGGLTVIANAPNPAGYVILRDTFQEHEISSKYLFLGALPFTIIAIITFGLI